MTPTRTARARRSPSPADAGAALQPLGRGTLKFMGLAVYEAELSVAPGFEAQRFHERAFELALRYQRNLSGASIVDRSIDEMRRGGPLDAADEARWRAFMARAFPDVKRGEVLTGRWDPEGARSTFVLPSGSTVELADAAFGQRFFGIWLAPHSSQPALRAALLGLTR